MWEVGKSQSGMTLIETLVILAVVALVSAIIAPNMTQSLRMLSMRQAARVLQADLRVARSAAMRTGKPSAITPVASGRGYTWVGGTRQMPSAAVFSTSGPIQFMADGSAESATATIDAHGRHITFAVDGATGAVTPVIK